MSETRGKRMTTNPYIGSSLDDLLEEDGILEEVDAIAIKRVLAYLQYNCKGTTLSCPYPASDKAKRYKFYSIDH